MSTSQPGFSSAPVLRSRPRFSSVSESPKPRLQPDDLFRRLWRLRRAGGGLINPVLSFLPNGEIANHDVPGERRWAIAGDRLQFLDEDGHPRITFGNLTERDGRLLLFAPERGPDTYPVVIESRLLFRPPAPPVHSALHAEMTLSRPSGPLIVICNSGGETFDGARTVFDFFNLPSRLGVDCLRFAEHEGAFARYVDKTRLIERHLEHWLGFGYKRVVFLGLSAAGYISMLMAERLAMRFPAASFASVVVNAQLTLRPEANDALAALAPGRLLPPIWTDPYLDHADFNYLDIAEVLSDPDRTGTNVRHAVLYDSANPGEIYYSECLRGLPGVDLQPVPLGMAHAAGIAEINGRNLITAALERMLWE
jgi:hypothetical protein